MWEQPMAIAIFSQRFSFFCREWAIPFQPKVFSLGKFGIFPCMISQICACHCMVSLSFTQRMWPVGLFSLYNRVHDSQCTLSLNALPIQTYACRPAQDWLQPPRKLRGNYKLCFKVQVSDGLQHGFVSANLHKLFLKKHVII